MTYQEAIEIHIAENIHRIGVIEDFMHTNSDSDDVVCRKNISVLSKINGLLQMVQRYREIGTLEECWVAVEKQKPKKPIIENEQTQDGVTEVDWKCPVCGTRYTESEPFGEWCNHCGQKLDWSDL